MLASSLQRRWPHWVPASADIFWASCLHIGRAMGPGTWAQAVRHNSSDPAAGWLNDLPAVRLQADCKAFCSKLLIQGTFNGDC